MLFHSPRGMGPGAVASREVSSRVTAPPLSFPRTKEPTAPAPSFPRTRESTLALVQAILLACLAAPLATQAQTASGPTIPQTEAQTYDHVPAELREQLLAHLRTAQAALQAKDWAEAARALEAAVLIDPSPAGAWLDLASASTELGHVVSANAYFDFIVGEFKPPPALLSIIANYRARLLALNPETIAKLASVVRTAGAPIWVAQLRAGAGHDNNANSGLAASSLTLTFDGVPVSLLLDPTYRPRPDNFVQAEGSLRTVVRTPVTPLQLAFTARQRSYARETAFSATQLGAAALATHTGAWGEWGGQVAVEHSRLGGAPLYNALRLSLQLERPLRSTATLPQPGAVTCSITPGVEFEGRRFAQRTGTAQLDNNIAWLQAGLGCQRAGGIQGAAWLRLGHDSTLANRPGGDTRRSELLLQYSQPLPAPLNRTRLDASGNWSQGRDVAGYSPLLENNATRNITRLGWRLQLTHPIGSEWQLYGALEANRYRSNLEIFAQSGSTLLMGIQRNLER